ncbi:hypothetical protein [Sinorhizobium medicae]|uniref:hypothetical protein n=1 Tax=Sinorhizobium medicae TaxID=110321 RepID=UPI000FDB2D77|nr:hypothetical protein [Sinorhizobium medicae]RVP49997.1 hypothetical protein CN078_21395 [Sinorhizobium medicae]RVP74884.1 hypothetical protein CN079_21155 [Sinorhizobium medicae]UWU09381.1 hypothetical protein N2598_06465 [Sinorhizobium medicae]
MTSFNEALITVLGRIATALETMAAPNPILGTAPIKVPEGEVPVSPWESPNVPAGYDTVVSFFSKYRPSAFDLLDDPIVGTLHDGFWLTHQCNKRRLKITRVEAPEALREAGIAEVNAYPLSLLAERMAA